MTSAELHCFIAAAGSKKLFANCLNIGERYVDVPLAGDRTMSRRLDDLIRLKIVASTDADKPE